MNLTIYRDRRNEAPCDEDDVFSVPVLVEVTAERQGDEWDVRATVKENCDPVICQFIEMEGFEGFPSFGVSTRYLFKKGESIDLTGPEEAEAIYTAELADHAMYDSWSVKDAINQDRISRKQ